MRYAQLVMGPAGCGKSTYCSALVQHAAAANRVIDVVNLDPAAEFFEYEPLADIRDLIGVDDVMEDEDLRFGPNGGLVFCLEYLLENANWLKEALGEEEEDDYILFDCPGQIELYTHMTTMKELVQVLKNSNFQVCGVFLVDAQFMVDGAKFLSGTMAALSVMVNLELPHLNLLSKMDLLSKSARNQLDNYLEPDPHFLVGEVETTSKWNAKFRGLTEAIGRLIDDFSLVRFTPLNIKDSENLADVLLTIDNILQFGEEADVKTKDLDYPDPDEEDVGPQEFQIGDLNFS